MHARKVCTQPQPSGRDTIFREPPTSHLERFVYREVCSLACLSRLRRVQWLQSPFPNSQQQSSNPYFLFAEPYVTDDPNCRLLSPRRLFRLHHPSLGGVGPWRGIDDYSISCAGPGCCVRARGACAHHLHDRQSLQGFAVPLPVTFS
jgi:hypothetical protein